MVHIGEVGVNGGASSRLGQVTQVAMTAEKQKAKVTLHLWAAVWFI
jgi:hypothetical protein